VKAARIEPGSLRQVGVPAWLFARAAGRALGTQPPAVFLTIGRNKRLFWGWMDFAARLMPGGRLPRRETELVILRVATLAGCDYEFQHHAKLGRRAGLDDDDLARVVAGPDAPGWSPREATLLRTVDLLHHDRDLEDAAWAALREHLDERTALELLFLAGHYEMLATALVTLRVQPDRPRRTATR
jgi:AhpD family alkylhydroperoxidase